MELEELLKTAASPHLVASAKLGTELLARLQAVITDLRGEVSDLELDADLYHNQLLKDDNLTLGRATVMWKVSDVYRDWKKKAGMLTDVRSIRRNLERHTDLLLQQEKYRPRDNSHYSI